MTEGAGAGRRPARGGSAGRAARAAPPPSPAIGAISPRPPPHPAAARRLRARVGAGRLRTPQTTSIGLARWKSARPRELWIASSGACANSQSPVRP